MERVYKREGILFKILPCLLIAMYVVMCLYGSTVCATDVTVNGNTYTLNEEISNFKYISTVQVENYFYILCSNSAFGFFKDGTYSDGTTVWRIGFKNKEDYIYFNTVYSLSKIPLYTLQDFDRAYSCSSPFSNPAKWQTGKNTMSTFDLKDDDGNVVFQGASQEALATIIRPQVEGIQLQEILQEIIQILPVILVVIVALIAIRKAIHLLLRVLRNS